MCGSFVLAAAGCPTLFVDHGTEHHDVLHPILAMMASQALLHERRHLPPPPPIICPSFASSLNSGFSVAHTLPARSRPTKIFVAHYVAMETSAVGCGRACPPLMVAQSASVSVRGWRPHQRGKGPAKGQTDVLRENSRGKFPFSFPAFATPSHDPKPSHTGV